MDHVPTRSPFIQSVRAKEVATLPVPLFRARYFGGFRLRDHGGVGGKIGDGQPSAERCDYPGKLVKAGPSRGGFDGGNPALADPDAIAELRLTQASGIAQGAQHGSELRGSGNGVIHGRKIRTQGF